MKINKIICDICDEEIDIEKDSGLAIFEYIQAKTKIIFNSDLKNPQMNTERDLIKTSYDLCKNCADDIVSFIEKNKQEKKDKKVDKSKKEK